MKRANPAVAAGAVPRVNLMPRAETERRERDALARRWGIGVLAAILVVILSVTAAFWLKWTAEQRLAAQQLRTTELLTELAALSDVSQALSLRTELRNFRADAMVADLSWSELFADVSAALPAGVAVSGFDLLVGGASVGDDPESEVAMTGTLELTSASPDGMASAARALSQVTGVLQVNPLDVTSELEGDVRTYIYRLGTTFDQTVYSGAFAEEANG